MYEQTIIRVSRCWSTHMDPEVWFFHASFCAVDIWHRLVARAGL